MPRKPGRRVARCYFNGQALLGPINKLEAALDHLEEQDKIDVEFEHELALLNILNRLRATLGRKGCKRALTAELVSRLSRNGSARSHT